MSSSVRTFVLSTIAISVRYFKEFFLVPDTDKCLFLLLQNSERFVVNQTFAVIPKFADRSPESFRCIRIFPDRKLVAILFLHSVAKIFLTIPRSPSVKVPSNNGKNTSSIALSTDQPSETSSAAIRVSRVEREQLSSCFR